MTFLLAVLSIARADIAPPPDYVETCVETACPPGAETRSCSAYYGGREACEAIEKEGFTKLCQTAGASTWSEILCKGGDPNAAPLGPATPEATPAPEKPRNKPAQEEKRCATSPGFGGAGIAAGILLALGRRRR